MLIHGRELNAQRARAINAAACQAREFFSNATSADYTVRPLLVFYGVTTLGRALMLLLQRHGGEESLTAGHGLQTIGWNDVMQGDLSPALLRLGDLKVRTCVGMFSDFLARIENTIPLHLNSAGVDWIIGYSLPKAGLEFTLTDILSRLPDLQHDYQNLSEVIKYTSATEVIYNREKGLKIKLSKEGFAPFQSVYESMGYQVEVKSSDAYLNHGYPLSTANAPFFIHTYAQKIFGSIPGLYVAEPFPCGTRLCQLGMTYVVSYYLGMLVRYYPTHWITLINGEKGDSWWPTINRAQQMVETTFPELVAEFISHALAEAKKKTNK